VTNIISEYRQVVADGNCAEKEVKVRDYLAAAAKIATDFGEVLHMLHTLSIVCPLDRTVLHMVYKYCIMMLRTTYHRGDPMKELLTVVTRKGQITVPAEIRRALQLKEGDKVALSLNDKEKPTATLRPVRSVAEMTFGSVTPRKRPEDFKELRRLFEEGVAEEVAAEDQPSTKQRA